MISRSPQSYIPSFVKIGPLVPDNIFKGFLTYMDVTAILVMVMYPKAYMQNLVKIEPALS